MRIRSLTIFGTTAALFALVVPTFAVASAIPEAYPPAPVAPAPTTTAAPSTTVPGPRTPPTDPPTPLVADTSGARIGVDISFQPGQVYDSTNRNAVCSGLGLEPNSLVTCTLYDGGVTARSTVGTRSGITTVTGRVASNGRFAINFALPAGLRAGTYDIEVVGASPAGTMLTARAVFVLANGVVTSVVDAPAVVGRPNLPAVGVESARTADMALVLSLSGAGLLGLTSVLRRRLRHRR